MASTSTTGSGKKDRWVYTTCRCNCGSNSQCVLKALVRDGRIVAVEPDDRYHPGIGREDRVMSEKELIKTGLQRRPCAKGLAFHRYIYHPERILYPLKRKPGARRGEGRFDRISWDEALNIVAGKMEEVRAKYGRYSLTTPYMPNETLSRLFSFWGAGVDSWGWCSYDSARMISHLVAGEKGWDYAGYSSGSGADMFANAKSLIIWGCDPTTGSSGPGGQFAWYIKLCRERGVPVIIIDPRYTVAAEVLADQWIPIKPGTDHAMFLAIAYHLFQNEYWDRDFVNRYVELEGFEKWRQYVLGFSDDQPKNAEWAEDLCAVPAETIRALAEHIGTVRPSWLLCHWALSRKSRGEQTVRAFAALQAMMGYWGTPGAGPSIHLGPFRDIPWQASWGPAGKYAVPCVYRSHYWAEAVLLLEEVKAGRLSRDEYMRMVGWRADPAILETFNPKFLFWGGGGKPHASDHLVTACDTPNVQVTALNKMEFVVTMHSIMTSTVRYADVILPARDWMWEERNIFKSGPYGGFECINYCPQVVAPPAEVRSWVWVYVKLAEKLGIDPCKFFKYYTTDANWEDDWGRYLKDSYRLIEQWYGEKNISIPSWERFTTGHFINCDELEDKPFTGWDNQIKKGLPFNTRSGKIEFFSFYVNKEENRGGGEHRDHLMRVYDNLPSDWGPLTPMAVYQEAYKGMNDSLVRKYPLMLLAPHARHRVHYLFWEHVWLRNHLYRHRVWLSVSDAAKRSVKDNDLVMVYNERGKVVMPAYVTARLLPGIVVIHHGGKYIPDASGIDFGGSPSTLLGGDFKSCITPAKASGLVEVKKFQEDC